MNNSIMEMKAFNKSANRSFKKLRNRFLLPGFIREMKNMGIGGLSAGTASGDHRR
jgi:hypothetical protein